MIADASGKGDQLGAQLGRDPGWLVRQALPHWPCELFAALVLPACGGPLQVEIEARAG